MKHIFLSILFFSVFTISAQQNWAIIELNNEIDDMVVEEVIPIVDQKSGDLATFFRIKTGYIAYLYDENQHLITSLKINLKHKNIDILIGSAHENMQYTLFFSNDSNTKYSFLKVDFKTNTSSLSDEKDFKPKKERLITYSENENELYAMSIIKNSSELKLYRFAVDGSFSKKQYDFSGESFETDSELPIPLYSVLFGKYSDNSFETVNSNIPNTLETASAMTKVYLNNNTLQLTNNTFRKYTYALSFDLQSDDSKLLKIENKNFDKKNRQSNSNSFVLNNLLFDIYSNSDDINFNVYDYKSNNLIKKFSIIPGDSIPFKNSPIIHEILESNYSRDLETTTRFIRKVNGSKIGISAYAIGDNYVVTLGSSEKIQSGEMAIIGGIIGGVVGAALFSALDSYNKTRSTRILCLFDKNFNHLEGDVPSNGFDLINDFIEEKDLEKAKLQTVFKYKDGYIWGSYNKAGRFYRFYQFHPNSTEN